MFPTRRLACVACLTLSFALSASAAPFELEQAIELLDRLEQTLISVEFDDMPLAAVVDELAERGGQPIRADWEALRRLGVRPRDVVTYRVDHTSALTVIGGLALLLGDELDRPVYEVSGGQIVLTTRQATTPMRLTAVYDVRDLVAAGTAETLRPARPEAPAGEGALPSMENEPAPDEADAGDHEAAAPAAPTGPRPAPAAPPTALLELILEHVEPDAWLEFGGTRARIAEHDGALLVTATPTVHRRVRGALERLRSAQRVEAALELAIVEIGDDDLRALQRSREQGGPLARGLMRDPRATIRWRSTATVALGSPLSLHSEGEGGGVSIQLVPRIDDAASLLRVELRASMHAGEAGADGREVSTTVILRGIDGGAAVELPSADPAAPRMFVVVLK